MRVQAPVGTRPPARGLAAVGLNPAAPQAQFKENMAIADDRKKAVRIELGGFLQSLKLFAV